MTLDWQQALFDREVKRFLSTLLPEVADAAVRKMAFDVVWNVMTLLNGLKGLPKRIDTGRLRGAWRVAMANGGFVTKGLPRATRGTSGAAGSGDGEAGMSGAGSERTATVINRVEYAPHVEHGTATMEPGKHLEVALRTVRQDIPKDPFLPDEMAKAWGQ